MLECRLFQGIWLSVTSQQKHGSEYNFDKNNFEHPRVNDLSWPFFYAAHQTRFNFSILSVALRGGGEQETPN